MNFIKLYRSFGEERNLIGLADGNADFLRRSVNFHQTAWHYIPEDGTFMNTAVSS
jgi:hypothetical protein